MVGRGSRWQSVKPTKGGGPGMCRTVWIRLTTTGPGRSARTSCWGGKKNPARGSSSVRADHPVEEGLAVGLQREPAGALDGQGVPAGRPRRGRR